MPFQIIRNDITKVKADAIVNTANPKPIYGGGTDSAIYKAAGEELLLAARMKIGDIARGEAVETPAFGLDAKYIIHTVGPMWEGGDKGEFDILRSCYENSLQLAYKLKCRSVAFPLISTGGYGFPNDKALQTALSAIQAFLMENSMKVILVVFDKRAFELSGNVVENVREFVDANYVEEAKRREYTHFPEGSDRKLPLNLRANLRHAESEASTTAGRTEAKKKIDLGDLLARSDKTFQEKLFEIIDERGLTGPQVYHGYISKQVFSKIQSDKNYHPNKKTAILLCLSLHLNVSETQDLIGRAGWTLSDSSKTDLVIKGCIMNREYNLGNIESILFDFDCPGLIKYD